MSKDIKKDKKQVEDNQENFILKKIRYYQGSIKDYETYWNDKIAEGEREESSETKSFAKRNAELNKAYEIVPVEKDETVICKDIVSGEDVEKASENPDVKPDTEEGNKDAKKDAGLEAEKEGEKVEDEKKEKKEKKEEKHVEEEEEKVEDAKKEEKGEDDDNDKKKSKKKDKED